MNDIPEEEEVDATTDILIGEGEDRPEDYSDGFDAFINRDLANQDRTSAPF